MDIRFVNAYIAVVENGFLNKKEDSMKNLMRIALVTSMLPFATLALGEQSAEQGSYGDLVNSSEGWLSDVRFDNFGVWNGSLSEDGSIELTFWAQFTSAFGVPVKLDVQRVYVGADGTQHFVLRPLRVPREGNFAGGQPKEFSSRVTVTVPVGFNGPLVHLYAITSHTQTTKIEVLPAIESN
jgi:hypothetical protein